MICLHTIALLGFAPPPGAQGSGAGQGGAVFMQLGMFAILGVMFYVMIIRPQRKKAQEHAALLSALKPGDKVLTNGGIVGVVVSVRDKVVSIRSADTKLEMVKSAITEVTEKSSSPSSES